MKIQLARLRVTAAALTLCGMAAAVAAAGTVSAPTATAAHAARPAATVAAARDVPVLVNCLKRGDVRPGTYVFTCADANTVLTGLRWFRWAGPDAYARGTYSLNDCVPACVQGHRHTFPALVVVWRAEPWPGHHGARYFSRMTMILPGNRSYRAGGHVYHLPVTQTGTLSASGG